MSDELDRLKAALTDRYEILREVGSGGMATVYLAQDVRHQRQVALKVLRSDLAATLGPERFLQEVRVTANLQHPHILPLFDSGEADGFLYYVMPYIDGESLRDRLVRERELPITDAARILRDVVDALAAAHRVGVVHRDIKPENILLTGRHAVVADFGVAKAVTEATGRHRLTTMGVALGTPSYMAPEQAAADTNIDHRADLYAVGAMGYELVAGRPPFSGRSPQEVLTAQVTKTPEPVTEHRAAVPPALGTLIMRCLEKKPADRWQKAEEMLPHLEAAATPSGGVTPTGMEPVTVASDPAPVRPPRWALMAAMIALALAGVYWASARYGGAGPDAAGSTRAGTGAGSDSTPTIAVLPLENRTGDPEAHVWGTLVSETATRLLDGAASDIEVVASGAVRETAAELGWPTEASREEMAGHLGASHVVSGSYTRLGGSLRFDVEISDATTGELVLALEPISGAEDEADATVGTAGEAMASAAAFRLSPELARAGSQGMSPPRSLEVLDLHRQGLDLFCVQDYDAALRIYERSIELEPTFLYPYFGGMAAHGNGGRASLTGDDYRTRVEAYQGRMTSVERDFFSWLVGGPEDQLRAARRMVVVAPTNWGYGLAFAAVRFNHLEAALEGVSRIDFESPCWKDWPAIWLMPVGVYHLVGDGAAQLEAARAGRERFPGDPTFVWGEATAELILGNLERAEALAADIEAVPSSPGSVVNAMVNLGRDSEAHGDPELAERLYERVWTWTQARDLPVYYRAAAAFRALSPEEALPFLEEARDSLPQNSYTVGRLAITLDRLGRADEAEALAESIYALSATSPWPALFYAQRGDATRAVQHLRRVFDAGRVFNNVSNLFLHHAPELLPIADDPAFQNLMRPKTGS